MDLRHVRTFVTVAETGTVSKAAERLHVAQPALSRQIANLEDELGLKLFDRVGRRLMLTSEGERLLNDCRGLLNYARAVGEQAQVLRRGDVGVLRVSASPHLIEGIFPDFLRHYAARYPNVQVRLVDVAAGGEALAMLERGEIHLVQTIVRAIAPDEERFASHPLAPMQMLAACHPKLKLGTDGSVEIGRLAPYPLLQATPDFAMRRNFDAACRLAGFTPNNVLDRARRMRCLPWRKPGTASPSSRRRCASIATAYVCSASLIAARHWRNRSPCSPTSAARCQAMRRCSATCSPSMFARAFRCHAADGSEPDLLDDAVCAEQKRARNRDAQCLRGFRVDGQIELLRRLDWKIGRLGAAQDAVDVSGATSV